MIVPVHQQLPCDVFRVASEVKWNAVRLCIPVTGSTIFLTGESFGTNVQSGIVATVRLIQVENVEPDGLLRSHIACDLYVSLRPNLGPSINVACHE